MTTFEPFQKVLARFTPQRTDDLQNDAGKWIGYECEWRALWVIEEGRPYAGQMAFAPVDPEVWFGWVPESDLKLL